MNLFIVYTGTATSDEEPSHLLIRAASEGDARVIAARTGEWGFSDGHALYVDDVDTDGAAGVVGQFRRPV